MPLGNLSSLRKQATENFSSSPASSADAGDRQESSGLASKFNIPRSSKVAKTFSNIGNRGAALQSSEPPVQQTPTQDFQNTAYTSPSLPSAPVHASAPYLPPPGTHQDTLPYVSTPLADPVHSDTPLQASYRTPNYAQKFSHANPDAPAPTPALAPTESVLSPPYEVSQASPVSPAESHSQPLRPDMDRKKSSFSFPWSQGKEKGPSQQVERSLLSPTAEKSPSKSSKPQFNIKIPKALRGMANLSELEVDFTGGEISIVSDTKKKQRKEGLCTSCSKIDFEQFNPSRAAYRDSEGEKLSRKLIFLDRILRKKKKDSCHFCTLIFDAIAENDPFDHPAVKDHLPPDLAGMTFNTWAESLNWAQHVPLYKVAYPFGRSRDNVKLHQEGQGEEVVIECSVDNDELTSNDAAKVASATTVAALNVGIWTDTDLERVRIMATVGTIIPTLTSFMTGLDAKLPVAISIIIHNANDVDAGLLNVDVWGYGNGHRAPLSRISNFALRIASGYQSSPGGVLSYGKLLHPEFVDVEGDCGLWLENCARHHGGPCEEPSWWNELEPPSGPHFRLIDVNAVRVVQKDMTELLGDDKIRYAALSYVWGAAGKRCLNLRVWNREALGSTLENQGLPMARTIRDAIEVTRRMGLQYIWVDSLCIIQRDDGAEDDPEARAQQIQQMDRIFGHATITIVAADGLDADAGLPGISLPTARRQIAREVQPHINVLLAAQYRNTLGKWDTRAWTFQEKILSKRMLIFNGGYVSFHCRHGILREDMPAVHAGNGPAQIPWVSEIPKTSSSMIKRTWDGSPVLLRSHFFTEYANLLAQYTSRDMTDSRDALNAVLGLLKVLEKMAADKSTAIHRISRTIGFAKPTDWTLHGLPEKFLDLALLWQPPAAKGVCLTKRQYDDLPSWSWIGWEVSKDPDFNPDAAEVHSAKPGVRFEDPFWVATNDDLSLKKVLASAGDDKQPPEERLKPLVMWYKCLSPPISYSTHRSHAQHPPQLIPVNGHGVGLKFGAADAHDMRIFQEEAIKQRAAGGHLVNRGPPSIQADVPLDTRHLVCSTSVAKFRLRSTNPRHETLYRKSNKGLVIDTLLLITEAEILDAADNVVGRVVPTDQRKGLSSSHYDFILLSEAQYWGNENRVDVSGYPLFNVMVVSYDIRREFASRIGLGRIHKDAWWKAYPQEQVVILK